MLKNAVIIEQKLGAIENLPTLPLVLRQIQKVLQNPRSNMAQIAMIVAKDQALASRTIRLVNSAFYAMRERVTSINHALVILGLNTLNSLMIGLSVVKLFKNSSATGFDPEKFWEHCFGTALLARSIGEIKGCKELDQIFSAGLLHDMGRLVLDQFLHDEFFKALVVAKDKKIPLFECEKAVLGFDHGEAGAWLGMKWGLPEIFNITMAFHHNQDFLPENLSGFAGDLKIISVADKLCNSSNIGNSGETVNVSKILCPVDGFTSKQTQEIVDKARADVKSTIEEWNKAL
jgi:HD-like signal output (HDOD) protein